MMMTRLRDRLGAFVRDENGAALIEYGLLAAGISVAIIAIVFQLGSTLAGNYQATSDGLAGM